MRSFFTTPSFPCGRKAAFRFRLLYFGVALCIANVVPTIQAGVKVTYASGPEIAAMFIKFGRPDYPYEARRARRTGSGIFRVYINPDGRVKTVGVVKSTGHPDLDLAAAAGLYHCLAKPGGRREVDLPVTFTMTPADYENRGVEGYLKEAATYALRAERKQRKGELDAAIDDYNRALELMPKDADLYNNRGDVERAKGDLSAAIADYNRALKLNPKHSEANKSLRSAQAEQLQRAKKASRE